MPGREDIFQQAMSTGHSAAWDQQWDQAVEAYRQALSEFPDNPKALISLGLALIQQQQYEEALKCYQHAAQITANDPIPFEKIAQLQERLGDHPKAIQASLKAAELFIKNQEIDKAIENWVRVTQLDPAHLTAHQYLEMVHEKMGHAGQAVTECLALASLLQAAGNGTRAAEMVGRALRIAPGNQEARQAQNLLKNGHTLPRPMRSRSSIGPLHTGQLRKLEIPAPPETSPDPVMEARQHALARLAEVLFEYSDAGIEASAKRGMTAIVKGTGPLTRLDSRSMILLHLSQAIDMQTKGNEAQAAEELQHALDEGFSDPALYFTLGMLQISTDHIDDGLRHLQKSVKHESYALGARLLMAAALEGLDRLAPASIEYLEALKLADAAVVPPAQAETIRQLYEPLIEAQTSQAEDSGRSQLCENIRSLLNQKDWRVVVKTAREQLPTTAEGTTPIPLAGILIQAQSSQVIEAMSKVNQLARSGHLRSAMEEAFFSLQSAPTYLPLHTLVGDLLILEGRQEEAIAKYSVVAQAYSVRGEGAQATTLLRRIIQVSPMDLTVRNKLVDHLVARGQVEEALGEYLDLADMHYRLAELDLARKTHVVALRHAQQVSKSREWSLKILQRMADIDLQRLDWKQAVNVLEQIRTLRPEDRAVRKNLIELYLRLNDPTHAQAELENFIGYLESLNQRHDMISFLEDLVTENSGQAFLVYAVAQEYHKNGQTAEAVAKLDSLGNSMLDSGDTAGAVQAIEAIISMNPPNLVDYIDSLAQLKKNI